MSHNDRRDEQRKKEQARARENRQYSDSIVVTKNGEKSKKDHGKQTNF